MATKLLSFDLMEACLGTEEGCSPLARDDDRDTEYRRMLRVLPKIIAGELTQRQQECVRLYYFEGMKMHEIADTLGIQTPAVSRHLKKARRRIEQILQYSFTRLANNRPAPFPQK